MRKHHIFEAYDLVSINTMLSNLLCLRRWSELTVSSGKYNELAKQALNCVIAFFWALIAQHEGYTVDLTVFPKIAILRGLKKTFQADISENNLQEILKLGNISKKDYEAAVRKKTGEKISDSLFAFLEVSKDSLEAKIYQAATKVATLLELEELHIPERFFNQKKSELLESINSFAKLKIGNLEVDFPGYKEITSGKYDSIFTDYSQLRNRVRWALHPNLINCSVLGHHFDVAVLSYLMALEEYDDEEKSTRFFFMGVFHDFPERWTGDMPSPVKDSVKGLRAATEQFENQVMKENVYSHLPDYLEEALRKVMLEDEANIALKKFLKLADNYGAFLECWRELDTGSTHKYYKGVFKKSCKRNKLKKLPPSFRRLARKLYRDILCRSLFG